MMVDAAMLVLIGLLGAAAVAQMLAYLYQLHSERVWLQEQLAAITHETFELRRRNEWLERRLFDLVDAAELAIDNLDGSHEHLSKVAGQIKHESKHNGYGAYFAG